MRRLVYVVLYIFKTKKDSSTSQMLPNSKESEVGRKLRLLSTVNSLNCLCDTYHDESIRYTTSIAQQERLLKPCKRLANPQG